MFLELGEQVQRFERFQAVEVGVLDGAHDLGVEWSEDGQLHRVLPRRVRCQSLAQGVLALLVPRQDAVQLTIFTPLNAEVVRAIENADLDNLKPLEALNLLAELKKQIQS